MPIGATIRESDLEEAFIRSSGPGGQNVNKVATKVVLRHIPTGITVSVQESRSQAANRELARDRLAAALQERRKRQIEEARRGRERLRRQNRPRPKGLKRKILEDKRRRGEVKRERSKTWSTND